MQFPSDFLMSIGCTDLEKNVYGEVKEQKVVKAQLFEIFNKTNLVYFQNNYLFKYDKLNHLTIITNKGKTNQKNYIGINKVGNFNNISDIDLVVKKNSFEHIKPWMVIQWKHKSV